VEVVVGATVGRVDGAVAGATGTVTPTEPADADDADDAGETGARTDPPAWRAGRLPPPQAALTAAANNATAIHR
jgi:hypothetical protein